MTMSPLVLAPRPPGDTPTPFATNLLPGPTTENADDCDKPHHRVRQWTGTPIRAVVPLPRRTSTPVAHASPSPRGTVALSCTAAPTSGPVPVPGHFAFTFVSAYVDLGSCPAACSTASRRVRDEPDSMDASGDDPIVDARGEDEHDNAGGDSDVAGRASARCWTYASITATEGLSAWSFEELRFECYAQSLIARGTKPPPVVQPSLAIPPAFVPRKIPRN